MIPILPIKGSDELYIDPPSDLKRCLKLEAEDVLRLRKAVCGLVNAPLRWHQRLSRALRQAGFMSLQMDPCALILPVSSPVKPVSKLKAAVVDFSGLPVLVTQMDRWKRQRSVQGVLGVHVGDLVGGGNFSFRKLCNGFGLNLNLEPGNKVDFDFVVENCVKSTIENPSRSPCQSLFKK